MTKYNEAQVEFREKSKGRIQRQLEISEWQADTQTFRVWFKKKYIYISFRNVIKANIVFCLTAGKATTDEELEEMLDGGNAAVFTAGVSTTLYILLCVMFCWKNITCLYDFEV